MSIFKVLGENLETHDQRTFYVDNVSLKVYDEPPEKIMGFDPVDLSKRGKAGLFRTVKIQLGLNCNYSCSYCSQRSVARPDQTTPKDIDNFLQLLSTIDTKDGFRIEFWGGEPFVYWKTLKPLAEKLHEKYPNSPLSVITNGSLLTKEIIDWLDALNFSMAISHDGPGQHMRGDDPLVDNIDTIRYAVEKFVPQGRFSFSSMLNKTNNSRTAIIKFFEEKFPGYNIPSSEMGFIDIYNDDGMEAAYLTYQDLFDIRRNLWSELRFMSTTRSHCINQSQKIDSIVFANYDDYVHRPIRQKCGMDSTNVIALDLKGNIITCQNVSSAEIAPNGISHNIGHISDLKSVKLTTSKHWTQRDNCKDCPVLSYCRGSCMFLDGDMFEESCELSYTDNITQFAMGFEQVTGYVPVYIESENLPQNRKDVFGSFTDVTKLPPRKRKKIINIKQV